MARSGPRREDHENAPVGVHVVDATLRIVLRHHDGHVLPVRSLRQELDQPPQGQVVVGHVALEERIAGLRTLRRAMVVRQQHREHRRKGIAAHTPPRLEFLDEHVHPELVRDGHVVGRVAPRRAIAERSRRRVVDRQPDARVAEIGRFEPGGEFNAETEVEEVDAVPIEVVPDASRLGIVLRVDGTGRSHEGQGAGGRRSSPHPALSPVRGGDAGLHPLVRIDAHEPAVPVGRHVGVTVEVVRDREPAGERKVVGHHGDPLQVARAVPRGNVHTLPEPRQRRFARTPGELAEDLVVRPVLLRDEHHVPDRRRRGTRVRGHGVVSESGAGSPHEPDVVGYDAARERIQTGVVGYCNNGNKAVHQVADVGSPVVHLEGRSAVRPAPPPLGVRHEQGAPVRRDGQLGGKPAHRNMADHDG